MYWKVLLVLFGFCILIVLVTLLGPRVGISPLVVFPFAAMTAIIGIGCLPLLFLLIFAILTTPDDPQVKSENLRRCGFLILLALLGMAPTVIWLLAMPAWR